MSVKKNKKQIPQPSTLTQALYSKYFLMAEYHNLHQINQASQRRNTAMQLLLEQFKILDNHDECLCGYFTKYQPYMKKVVNYYRFQILQPPCHIDQLKDIMRRYEATKMKIHYRWVKRQLKMEVSQTEETAKQEQTEEEDNKVTNVLNFMKSLRSESQSILEIIGNLGGQSTKKVPQRIETPSFIEANQTDRTSEKFEEFMRNEQPKKASFLKKSINPIKNLKDIIQQANNKKMPKISLRTKKPEDLKWSPVYNFIQDLLVTNREARNSDGGLSQTKTQPIRRSYQSLKPEPKQNLMENYKTLRPLVPITPQQVIKENLRTFTHRNSEPNKRMKVKTESAPILKTRSERMKTQEMEKKSQRRLQNSPYREKPVLQNQKLLLLMSSTRQPTIFSHRPKKH